MATLGTHLEAELTRFVKGQMEYMEEMGLEVDLNDVPQFVEELKEAVLDRMEKLVNNG